MDVAGSIVGEGVSGTAVWRIGEGVAVGEGTVVATIGVETAVSSKGVLAARSLLQAANASSIINKKGKRKIEKILVILILQGKQKRTQIITSRLYLLSRHCCRRKYHQNDGGSLAGKEPNDVSSTISLISIVYSRAKEDCLCETGDIPSRSVGGGILALSLFCETVIVFLFIDISFSFITKNNYQWLAYQESTYLTSAGC